MKCLIEAPKIKKRYPADSEAVEGMGPISTHKGENLMPTDRGISLYRRRVRKQIRDLVKGGRTAATRSTRNFSIRTYGQDTVLSLPALDGEDDDAYLSRIGEAVMNLEFEIEDWCDENRDLEIIKRLKILEASGIG